MKWLWSLLLTIMGQEAKKRLFGEGRRLALITYLRALRAARRMTLFAVFVLVSLQLILIAGFGALVCGVLLFESDPHRQLQILFTAFATLFVVPLLALCILLSERIWFRASGASRMVEDLAKK